MPIIDLIKGLWVADSSFFTWFMTYGRTILDYLHTFFNTVFYLFLYITMIFTLIYLVQSLFVVFQRKKEKEGVFDEADAPTVTVQIPTRNELVALRCAEKCLAFDYPKGKYEILIGDDSDKPEVSQKIAAFAAKYEQVKVIKREKNIGFKPGNLQNMLPHSRGDILVMFDSDFMPERDFLKRIVTPFIHDQEVSAVQAKWNFSNFNQNFVTVLSSTIVYVFHHVVLNFLHLFGSASLCGSAEAVRKKDLIELGGWTSGSLTEDIEYTLRLYKAKKKITYLPHLQCDSEVPFVASDLYKQQMRWAYGVVTSYKTHIKDIVMSKSLSLKEKGLSFCSGFGYGMPVLILVLFLSGTLSFVTHRPGPINLSLFFSEMVFNILLTSGLMMASLFALYREKKIRYALKMLASSFSIGLVTTYYVNKGIFKSLFKKPMEWYLLNKDPDYVKQ